VIGCALAAGGAPVVAEVVAPTTADGCGDLVRLDTIERVLGVNATHVTGPEAFDVGVPHRAHRLGMHRDGDPD